MRATIIDAVIAFGLVLLLLWALGHVLKGSDAVCDPRGMQCE